ncbi:uncharacterized protein [Misgurnus anguillicaudatus]|uniref:uncharacterized protein n=1 Tax=Misgurnus anguillicaudatus TaxID=75329 RepID=UPI003CCF6717
MSLPLFNRFSPLVDTVFPVQVDASARAVKPRDPPTFPVPREVSVQVHRAASPQSPRGGAESVEPDVGKVQGESEIKNTNLIQNSNVYREELIICTDPEVSSPDAYLHLQVPRTTTEGTPKTGNNMLEGEGQMMRGKIPKESSLLNEPQPESLSNTSAIGLQGGPILSVRREPTRHRRTNRKIFDWEISIKQKVVIIGDSNLARIPFCSHADVQIDSFPGATFYHINGVLEKILPKPLTEIVILSVGLNNCLGKQETTTTCKQLQQLLRTSKAKFPNAQIYIPIINFSENLENATQGLLGKLNSFIGNKCQFLPDMNRLLFRTEPHDPVHWTRETATNILTFWLDQLNF